MMRLARATRWNSESSRIRPLQLGSAFPVHEIWISRDAAEVLPAIRPARRGGWLVPMGPTLSTRQLLRHLGLFAPSPRPRRRCPGRPSSRRRGRRGHGRSGRRGGRGGGDRGGGGGGGDGDGDPDPAPLTEQSPTDGEVPGDA